MTDGITVDDVLMHYGILGMRWGVRRERGANGLVGSAKVKPTEKITKAQRKYDSKHRSLLSDEELLRKIGRLEKEKKFRELTNSEVDSGKAATQEIMKEVGKRVATTVVTATAIYAVRAALQKKFNLKELADALKPKSKQR